MVIGWSMAEHMRDSLCTAALRMARNHGYFDEHPVIFHSDQGTQYTSEEFPKWCGTNKVTQSISKVGVCWDCQTLCRIISRRFGSPGRDGLTHVGIDTLGVFALICQPRGRAATSTAAGPGVNKSGARSQHFDSVPTTVMSTLSATASSLGFFTQNSGVRTGQSATGSRQRFPGRQVKRPIGAGYFGHPGGMFGVVGRRVYACGADGRCTSAG